MKDSKIEILNLFEESSNIIRESKILANQIQEVVKIITACLKNGKKILIFGNGGSAADAQHMAGELVGRYLINRKSLPAIALTTDSSIITAIGNDFGFEKIFSRQCEALVKKGDVVIAISTSGKSTNVIKGVQVAKKIGGKIITITGKSSRKLNALSDISLSIPSDHTPRIQEGHRTVIHIICELVEKKLKNK